MMNFVLLKKEIEFLGHNTDLDLCDLKSLLHSDAALHSKFEGNENNNGALVGQNYKLVIQSKYSVLLSYNTYYEQEEVNSINFQSRVSVWCIDSNGKWKLRFHSAR